MLENELAELYRKIASKVNDIIPVEWDSVFLGAEIDDYGSGGVYFFFDTLENKGNYVYSADICDNYVVDKSKYDKMHLELFFLVNDLLKVFVDYDQEPWFMLIMKFNRKGELEVNYEYIDWFEGGFDPGAVINYFKAKYLGYKSDIESVEEELKRMAEYANHLQQFENTKRRLVEKVISEIKKFLGDFEYWRIVFDGRPGDNVEGINFYINRKEQDIEYLSLDDVIKIKNSIGVEVIEVKKCLCNIIEELRDLYVEDNRDEWFSIMISYDSGAGVDWEFTYSNWYELNYRTNDIINYFKYIYLDMEPESKKIKKIVLDMMKHEDDIFE